MRRISTIAIPLVGLCFLSCLGMKQERDVAAATALALTDAFQDTSEAVVWVHHPDGRISSHWIKGDIAGVIVIASRWDAVAPVSGGLWQYAGEVFLADHDYAALTDLVSGEVAAVVVDEAAPQPEQEAQEADAGVEDGGDGDAPLDGPSEGEAAETDMDSCAIAHIQSAPRLLGGVGPYLFFTFEEKQYDCANNLLLTRDRYVSLDLRILASTELLTDAELADLLETEEAAELRRGGTPEHAGIAPVYDGLFNLGVTHVLATTTMYVQENGDRNALVASVELSGRTFPASLAPFQSPPELVQAFAVLNPQLRPAGWWPIVGDPDTIARQLTAFLGQEAGGASQGR